MARMRSRASTLRTAFAVLLIVGVIGSVFVGFQAGKSVNFATVITTLRLLGISWIIDGQADLLEGRPGED